MSFIKSTVCIFEICRFLKIFNRFVFSYHKDDAQEQDAQEDRGQGGRPRGRRHAQWKHQNRQARTERQ